ncbi:aminotransferase class I/II-fold pyridoxal phosphate-dependent enzyme [uncultured Sanguibacteroides sp.]|uniref:DegT/DnrJ/EryC1/StrS family aminotransferase n=1 Tax=uncultured Sanguibacteroides sp. TaxID=1635151 RepID=UPI0025CFC2F1|nr:aminotransferase class I/II-fold pyridoxal phosphate-dependent enzyme [uncultured Sanguibacteroides sp.]
MKSRIWLSLAHMGGREQEFIREAFDTNWVVPLGPNVDAFEKALAAYLREDKHVVALSAGTAALHLGLILLGAGVGDEVICQSFTFSASANPIMYQGAKPVFVDSEASTWNMDPVLLEEAIKDRLRKTGKLPKAIIPVHLYGMPARLDRICEIAGRYGIPVLEDAAEALGSEFKGRKCGTFGELAALSFNGNKMITTSGGGALVCRSEEEAGQVKFYATQARDAAPHYQHSHIGYNYRMSNICAGIGRGQMFVLEEHVARRRAIHALYTSLLKDIPGISVLQNPSSDFDSNFWLTCITVDPLVAGCTRENIRLALDADNIESRPLWKPMHLQPVFAEAPFYGNGTSEHLFDIGLCLPSGPTLTDEDIERVVSLIDGCICHKIIR